MVALKIALRSLLRRKVRMTLIGLLVFLGSILIICGETVSLSARHFCRKSIIDYFTGDLILYASGSREKPSPFSFTTPLPLIPDPDRVTAWLDSCSLVSAHVAIAQNYGLMSIETADKKTDVPFIFYAVDPVKYRAVFDNIDMKDGTFFEAGSEGVAQGVVLSAFQQKNYADNYSVELQVTDPVTLLSISDGGSVNALSSRIAGIYEPRYYRNVFNYINFLDIASYAQLYNFKGVDATSMPQAFNQALDTRSDDDIFALAGEELGALDTRELTPQELTGYTLMAIKLKKSPDAAAFMARLDAMQFGVSAARWNEASGFFAYIATIIQAVIYGATLLIFLIVVFILMNTLIINVLERTGEIGTLRAMGGEKGLIRAIFLWESLLLNGSAALAGMAASAIIIGLIRIQGGIMLPDIMQQYLTGGGSLDLLISPRPFIQAVALILAVSVLATIYPIRVATAITPLKAMSGK